MTREPVLWALIVIAVAGAYRLTRHGLTVARDRRAAVRTLEEQDEQLQSALDAAARERDNFCSIINATNDGLLLLDNARRIVSANRRSAELLGADYRHLLNSSTEDVIAGVQSRCQDVGSYRDQLARHFERPEESYEDHLKLVQPVKRVLRRSSCPAWHYGQVVGRVFTYTDVTTEFELDRLKSDFVSMASHELRTPLTSIHGALQLAHAGSAHRMDPDDRELLDISLASTERLTRLVNSMLDLSKFEAAGTPADLRQLDAMVLLEETVRAMQGQALSKQIDLVAACQAPLEPFHGDQALLGRVLVNLVSNAIKYSPVGSNVRLSAAPASGGAIEISVEDEGPGIDQDQTARVFQPFTRVGLQPWTGSEGTGLGLATARAIVEQHGGRIWVERGRDGTGSRFVFSIPCQSQKANVPIESAVA